MTPKQIAQAVHEACVKAAQQAYEDAGIQGLCAEGRWEAAIGTIQTLDLERLLHELGDTPTST